MKRTITAFILIISLVLTAGCGQKAPSAPGFTVEDVVLLIDGNQYTTNMNISTVTDNLGDDYTYSDAISCDYDGLDKTYTYSDAEFYTFPLSDGDMVNEIYTKSSDIKTSKGLSVGSSKEDIIAAYGEGADSGSLLSYTLPPTDDIPNGQSLCFELEDNVVTAIFITTQPI